MSSGSLLTYGTGILAYSSGVALVPPAGRPLRAILIDCTTTGTVTLTFPDGSSATINVQGNTLYSFNYAVTTVTIVTGAANAYGIL